VLLLQMMIVIMTLVIEIIYPVLFVKLIKFITHLKFRFNNLVSMTEVLIHVHSIVSELTQRVDI
jgi:hypothetical protein